MGLRTLACVALAATLGNAIQLDITSADSVKSAASTIVYEMFTYYYGNQTGNNPGNLPPPYYWWECGGMFMHMVDYYYYTGDASNNPATVQAISWQAGENGEFMPSNQTKDEGNDDQVFWAFAAMAAAELNFPPPILNAPSYAAMGQAVFNLQTGRWDGDNCGGGLRWQIQTTSVGYTYKNVASNGGFFQLAARLARYTGNATYLEWADKAWDWIDQSVLLDKTKPSGWQVNDGTGIESGCTKANPQQFSYNYGILIAGLAYMYNHTSNDKYLEPLYGILNGTFSIFFSHDKIMVEIACEAPTSNCGTDGYTFKSFTLRWLALCAQLVPQTADLIWPYIQASAVGAAGQCDGPENEECGAHWLTTTYDGTSGVGQQMSALAPIQANMLQLAQLKPPLTLDTGATSKSDPSAGTTGPETTDSGNPWLTKPITTGDRAGAGILTFLLLVATLGGTYWLVSY